MEEVKLAVWKDEYSVGVAELDAQHRRMLEIINRLYQAMQEGKAGSALSSIIEELQAYTTRHFSDEERFLRGCDYPEFDEHANMHHEMAVWTQRLSMFVHGESIDLSYETLAYLKNWWLKHILKEDQNYAAFVRARPDGP